MAKTPKKPENASEEETEFTVGDLVFITPSGHEWITRSQKFPGINLSGRTAIILDIYDWESAKGKDILEKRLATGKWVGVASETFKYVVLVFYPDLEYNKKQGVMHPEMLSRYHPRVEGKQPLFLKYPKHLMDYISGEKKMVVTDAA